MVKNGKYFLPPQKDGSNFKELFKRLASAGAGRPVDKDGIPQGPWTADLLAEAITQIDANGSAVDLRTVQLWFQDNEKGISTDNIRWLARIFGCDDPESTSDWQAELSAAQSQLAANRRKKRKTVVSGAPEALDLARSATFDDKAADIAHRSDSPATKRRFSLARKSEAFFGGGSPLDLPASVFAGAAALGFFSYFLGIHSVTYPQADGTIKQIGFIWAPNWTILFMVFMPLFFTFVVELVVFWKNEGRPKLLEAGDQRVSDDGWSQKVESSSYTYWSVFLICFVFAGIFQWVGVRLIPLINGSGDHVTDWGSLAIMHPEIISVPSAIAFTGLAYLYMCLCFYLFFVGLILLYTLVHDLWKIGETSKLWSAVDWQIGAQEIGLRVMCGVFRCTVFGVMIAICMKLQTIFLTSNAENVVVWLLSDLFSVVYGRAGVNDGLDFSLPTHYSSLLIAIATCVVFLYSSVRLGAGSRFKVPVGKMSATIGLLVISYLLIGAFSGFSILLSAAVLLAIYGVFNPRFRRPRASELGDNENVL